MHSTASSAPQQTRRPGPLFNWLAVITLIYLILVAVGAVSHGFKGFSGGAEGAAQIFAFANNPFVALLLGILATALVQSSSTVTSVIVGLVAGGLPMEMAIPMVMGANLGTTITNTIVSLGHIRDREEFRRAFAAAQRSSLRMRSSGTSWVTHSDSGLGRAWRLPVSGSLMNR